MIKREHQALLHERLDQFPAVALLGPRQVGKTTLAEALSATRPSIYLDLETRADRAKLTDAASFLSRHEDKLVILDEVHRAPELFQELRGLIDRGRRKGFNTGRFLLLGSASMELLQQSGESLAGRIAYLELPPIGVLEIPATQHEHLWVRGGFPSSLLSKTDRQSSIWRDNFIRTYLERDIPSLGPRIPAETLHRFWTMLAHQQGGLLNAAHLARSLAVDGKTIARYLDLMVDLLLVRRLMPYHSNVRKRMVKSPKVYIRDSGITHTLLGIRNGDQLYGHPIAGASWEGLVIESLIASAPDHTQASFYRTSAGAEIDLLLELPGGDLWAIEIKLGLSPSVTKGFHHAIEDAQPKRCFVVYAGEDRYPLSPQIEAIGVAELVTELQDN